MPATTRKPRKSRAKPSPHPGGRPSKIDQPVTIPDGAGGTRTVTVAQRITEQLEAGAYFEAACAAANIHRETAYGWRRIGAQARTEIEQAPDDKPVKLTDHQRLCLEFSDAVDVAEATWEVSALLTLERLGRGSIPVEVITEKLGEADPNTGIRPVIERTTRREFTLPDAATLRWRLERRFPERYSRRTIVEGPSDGPPVKVEHQVAGILAALARVKDTDQ